MQLLGEIGVKRHFSLKKLEKKSKKPEKKFKKLEKRC
jgi:hypothetical protein